MGNHNIYKKKTTILAQRNNEKNNKPHNNIWHTILTYIHILITFELQKNLCNSTPELSDILWHPKRIYGPKVFLLTKIKPEYSDILYNPTHFPSPLVCRIREVPMFSPEELIRWTLIYKRIVRIKLDVCDFITITGLILLLVDFSFPRVSSVQQTVLRHWHS
jgi:hypothetical protein